MDNKCQNCPNSEDWVRILDHVKQAGAYRLTIIGSVVTAMLALGSFLVGYGAQKEKVNQLSYQINRIERNMPYVERKITDGRQMEGQAE